MPIIKQLTTFPLKSAGGIISERVQIDRLGFQMDRHWAIIDQHQDALTARKYPQLLKIKTKLDQENQLVLIFDDQVLKINQTNFQERIEIKTFSQTCSALVLNNEINQTLSNFLKEPVQLVFIDHEKLQLCHDESRSIPISFSDGYPIMILSKASIDDLNMRLSSPVNDIRFRANIIVDMVQAYEENNWKQIKINNIIFERSDPCARCRLVNIDPDTGKRDEDGEPLKTLAQYRKFHGSEIIFGQYFIPKSEGQIQIKDDVHIF